MEGRGNNEGDMKDGDETVTEQMEGAEEAFGSCSLDKSGDDIDRDA